MRRTALQRTVKAMVFDTFGTVVDWRGSLIEDFRRWGASRGFDHDWAPLVDAWRGAYGPSKDSVRTSGVWRNLDDLHRESLERLAPAMAINGLSSADIDYMVRGWHRLKPWPDAVAGLQRLKPRFILGPLSNGNVALLVNMARHAGLPWDMVFSAELFRHYKPDVETYLGTARLLDLRPEEVMLVAAHNYDLKAAQACGLKTAFVARPEEHGPGQTQDLVAEGDWDLVAADFGALAEAMGC